CPASTQLNNEERRQHLAPKIFPADGEDNKVDGREEGNGDNDRGFVRDGWEDEQEAIEEASRDKTGPKDNYDKDNSDRTSSVVAIKKVKAKTVPTTPGSWSRTRTNILVPRVIIHPPQGEGSTASEAYPIKINNAHESPKIMKPAELLVQKPKRDDKCWGGSSAAQARVEGTCHKCCQMGVPQERGPHWAVRGAKGQVEYDNTHMPFCKTIHHYDKQTTTTHEKKPRTSTGIPHAPTLPPTPKPHFQITKKVCVARVSIVAISPLANPERRGASSSVSDPLAPTTISCPPHPGTTFARAVDDASTYAGFSWTLYFWEKSIGLWSKNCLT
ncbi:hypothetical protein BDK51DRAFT_32402, partial [Blyttiomyces helicus]